MDTDFSIDAAPGINLEALEFGPTIEDCIFSEVTIRVLVASLGEGKTIGCIGVILQHAHRCGKPIRGAIIRDTLENIRVSIVPSFYEFFESCPGIIRFKDGDRFCRIDTDPPIEIDLFGIDDPASLERLKGNSSYSFIWLNEPAPIADKANAGLSEEVYKTSVVRCTRRKGTPGLLLIDMNPADKEHWTHRRLIETPDVDPEFPLITKQVWFVPYGENQELDEEARQAAKLMYKDDPSQYARYVEGKFAAVVHGPAVTPQYNPAIHLSQDLRSPPRAWSLSPFSIPGPIPSVVLGQITKKNRLIFLNTLTLEGSMSEPSN